MRQEKSVITKVHYKKGFKYQTVRLFCVATPLRPQQAIRTKFLTLLPSGLLFIAAGYAWDGASGPTYDSTNSIRASLIHDALYQLIRMGLLPRSLRPMIDRLFYDILREDQMWWIRAKIWYRSVRKLGWMAVGKPRKIYVAP